MVWQSMPQGGIEMEKMFAGNLEGVVLIDDIELI